MAEDAVKAVVEEDKPAISNESDGRETACFRKCHGPFCLTSTQNHFEYEVPLDFSPFRDSLGQYTSDIDDRIASLLQLDHSIDRITRLIANRHIKCVDLCLFYLKRVQATNDYHKCIIELNAKLLDEAKEMDQQTDEERKTKQLFGCVIAVKGNTSVRDMHNDAGAYVLHEKKMKNDAPVVKKLREAGCLILGRCNLSEWAYGMTEAAPSGFSAVGGQCIHPYDMHEDVSGSSSGSAAGLGLNLFTFSLGTETQGSLLSPALNVGHVCTLKPSLGSWPSEDIIPLNYDQDMCGPMARNVQDIELLHRLISGAEKNGEIRTLRVGFLGQSPEGVNLIQALGAWSPMITLVNLNSDLSLVQPLRSLLATTENCGVQFLDFLSFALERDVSSYLAAHSSDYSHSNLASVVEWNKTHSQYIPYGQSIFEHALASPITPEDYNRYKTTIQTAFKSFVECLKSKYSLDCLLTLGNDDIFSITTVCGIPRANLTLDYYTPDYQQINIVAVGFEIGDDLLILQVLRRLEQANHQAGKIDPRTYLEKYVQYPLKYAYEHRCSIL